MIQFTEQLEPRYRHASIDVFQDRSLHGRGIGTAAVRRVVEHLIEDRGHHRITIDPAATNAAAIRSYAKVGFRPVGVMRQYERAVDDDDSWHDGLLMELLVNEAFSPGAQPVTIAITAKSIRPEIEGGAR